MCAHIWSIKLIDCHNYMQKLSTIYFLLKNIVLEVSIQLINILHHFIQENRGGKHEKLFKLMWLWKKFTIFYRTLFKNWCFQWTLWAGQKNSAPGQHPKQLRKHIAFVELKLNKSPEENCYYECCGLKCLYLHLKKNIQILYIQHYTHYYITYYIFDQLVFYSIALTAFQPVLWILYKLAWWQAGNTVWIQTAHRGTHALCSSCWTLLSRNCRLIGLAGQSRVLVIGLTVVPAGSDLTS